MTLWMFCPSSHCHVSLYKILIYTFYKRLCFFKGRISTHELINSKWNLIYGLDHKIAEDKRYPSPTKKNIQAALKWLVKDSQSGDSLVFYFSGHGLRQPDFYEDELDGFDETICPVDFKTEGMILDNEINDSIVRPLKKGVTLHAIIDACHSGTILDLPYVFNIKEYV